MSIDRKTYPSNLSALLSDANEMASTILAKLNSNSCPTINSFYYELHKTCGAKPEYSIRRDKNVFNDVGYDPNVNSGKSKSLNEFKGLYVFGEEVNGEVSPIYVGICRTIYRRLRQHGYGKKT